MVQNNKKMLGLITITQYHCFFITVINIGNKFILFESVVNLLTCKEYWNINYWEYVLLIAVFVFWVCFFLQKI